MINFKLIVGLSHVFVCNSVVEILVTHLPRGESLRVEAQGVPHLNRVMAEFGGGKRLYFCWLIQQF